MAGPTTTGGGPAAIRRAISSGQVGSSVPLLRHATHLRARSSQVNTAQCRADFAAPEFHLSQAVKGSFEWALIRGWVLQDVTPVRQRMVWHGHVTGRTWSTLSKRNEGAF